MNADKDGEYMNIGKMAVFGGSLINKLVNNSCLNKYIEEKCMWIHPLTLCNKKYPDYLNANRIGRRNVTNERENKCNFYCR